MEKSEQTVAAKASEMIPMTAEDAARERRRKGLIIAAISIAVVLAAFYAWKLRSDPIEARQAFDGGERLLRSQLYNQAAILFSRTIGLQPDFAEAYFLRGRCFQNLFQHDKAIADFTKLAKLQPRDARAYTARGQEYREMKDLDRAFKDADKAIECNPKLGEAYNLRGMIEVEQGNSTAALKDFNTAIGLQPNADNHFQRGSLYQNLGRYREAEADFTIVIGFLPDASHPYFARAGARRALGDEAGARSDHKMGRYYDGVR